MENYKQTRERFRRYAIYRGFPQYADDFASFAIEQRLKGRITLLRYSLVDFLRLYHDKELVYPDVLDAPDVDKDKGYELDIKRIFPSGTRRVVLLLMYKWGLTQVEIAEVFGLTPGWVCRKLKECTKILE